MVNMGFSQQEIEILNSVPIQAPCTPSRRGCLRQEHNCGGKNTNSEVLSGLIFARTRETRPLAGSSEPPRQLKRSHPKLPPRNDQVPPTPIRSRH
ncbi:hypothetical protein DSO57_1002262 [Entomophthora muscae]|uniref:Uncharacterized protein n=1 Tax=Entomophthora muscae TaxID=34485 RepID=A0ACC2TK30_9FUNG|nr:hypothetical protein DSO57_1002262 [Entomophthora muscae]